MRQTDSGEQLSWGSLPLPWSSPGKPAISFQRLELPSIRCLATICRVPMDRWWTPESGCAKNLPTSSEGSWEHSGTQASTWSKNFQSLVSVFLTRLRLWVGWQRVELMMPPLGTKGLEGNCKLRGKGFGAGQLGKRLHKGQARAWAGKVSCNLARVQSPEPQTETSGHPPPLIPFLDNDKLRRSPEDTIG